MQLSRINLPTRYNLPDVKTSATLSHLNDDEWTNHADLFMIVSFLSIADWSIRNH